MTETIGGTTTYYAYVYNTAGRLAEVYDGTTAPCGDPPTTNCSLEQAYGYDENGNRTDDDGTSCSFDDQAS